MLSVTQFIGFDLTLTFNRPFFFQKMENHFFKIKKKYFSFGNLYVFSPYMYLVVLITFRSISALS